MEDKREYARVDVFIPIKYKKITDPEELKKPPRVFGDPSLLFPKPLEYPKDQVIADWLKYINSKLDLIINLLGVKKELEADYRYSWVNIGAGGISFETKEKFKEDEIIEIEMVLEGVIPTVIILKGTVSWCEETEGGYRIGVKFIDLPERVREIIARFVFEKQREILSKKRSDK